MSGAATQDPTRCAILWRAGGLSLLFSTTLSPRPNLQQDGSVFAEAEGFEPSIPFRVCRLSKPVPSATRPRPLASVRVDLRGAAKVAAAGSRRKSSRAGQIGRVEVTLARPRIFHQTLVVMPRGQDPADAGPDRSPGSELDPLERVRAAIPELSIAFVAIMLAAVTLGVVASSDALSPDQTQTLLSILGGPLMIGGAVFLYAGVGARLMARWDELWGLPAPAPGTREPRGGSRRNDAAAPTSTVPAKEFGPQPHSDELVRRSEEARESPIKIVLTHAVLAVAGSMVIGMLMRLLGVAPQEQGRIVALTNRGFDGSPEIIALMASALVLAPLAEEFFFRVLLFERLRLRAGESVAYLGSSITFAIVHFNPTGTLTYVWLALVFAHAYRRTGRVWVPVAVHAANNALTLAILFSVPTSTATQAETQAETESPAAPAESAR